MHKFFTSQRIEQLLSLGLGSLLFLLPWQTILIYQERILNGFKWQYGTLGYYATELLLWGTILLFIAWFWQQAKARVLSAEFHLTQDRYFVASLFLVVAYAFLSSLWAPFGDVASQQALRLLGVVLLFFLVLVGPLSTKRAIVWFVAGATVQAAFGTWQFLSQSTVASTLFGLTQYIPADAGSSVVVFGDQRWLRAYGAFAHPNVLGGYMLAALFAITAYINRFDHKDIRTRIALLSSYGALVMGLFFSFSRSAWMGFVILTAFTIYAYIQTKQESFKEVAIIGIGFFAVLSLLFSSLVITRIYGGSYTETRSITDRSAGYKEAATLFREHAIAGVGAGNYTAALYERWPDAPGWIYQPVHNVPQLVLAELGAIGVILFGIAIHFFFSLFKREERRHYFGPRELGLCLLPLLFFDHYLWSSFVGLSLCAVLLAFAVRTEA